MYLDIYDKIFEVSDYINEEDEYYLWFSLNNGELYNCDVLKEMFDKSTLEEDEMYLEGYIPFLRVSHFEIKNLYLESLNDKTLKRKKVLTYLYYGVIEFFQTSLDFARLQVEKRFCYIPLDSI